MFDYKWNIVKCVLYFGLPLNEEGRLQIRRGICLLVIWIFWWGEGGGVSSIHVKKLFFLKLFLMIQVYIEKQKGEILGVVIVESGWGSILPTVIIANMMHGGPAEKSGKLNIGDQIMSINGTSLVGLPLSTCQSIIKVWRMFLEVTHFKNVK